MRPEFVEVKLCSVYTTYACNLIVVFNMQKRGGAAFLLASTLIGLALFPSMSSFALDDAGNFTSKRRSSLVKNNTLYSKKIIAKGDIAAAGVYSSVSKDYVIPEDRDTHLENVTKSAMSRALFTVGTSGSVGDVKYIATARATLDYDAEVIIGKTLGVEWNKIGIQISNATIFSRNYIPAADSITKGLTLDSYAWAYKTPTNGYYGPYSSDVGIISISPECTRARGTGASAKYAYAQLGTRFISRSGSPLSSFLSYLPTYFAFTFDNEEFTGGVGYIPKVMEESGGISAIAAYQDVVLGGAKYSREIGDGVKIDVGVSGEFGSSYTDGKSVIPLATDVSALVLSPLRSLSVGAKIEYRGLCIAGEYNSWGSSLSTKSIPTYDATTGDILLPKNLGVAHVPEMQISSTTRATFSLPGLAASVTPKTSNVWQIAAAYDHAEYGFSATWMRGIRGQLYAVDGKGAGTMGTGGAAGQSTSSIWDVAAEYKMMEDSISIFAGYTSYSLIENDALKANDSNVVDNLGYMIYFGTRARF